MKKILAAFLLFVWVVGSACAQTQTEFAFTFSDPDLTGGKPIKLQAFEHKPASPNGKVIIFSHGSIGNSTDIAVIKKPSKFLNVAKIALEQGYTFVTFMRKGRGGSEGDFTEQFGRCSWGESHRQIKEAELQLEQVIQQAKERYGVDKVILMGHSRGGFLSTIYAAKHPEQVLAVVNLAGVWNAACQSRDGNTSRTRLEEAAQKKFNPQFWAYFERDSYFAADTFGDPNYEWFKKLAVDNGITFKAFSDGGVADGHHAPFLTPKEWADDFFPKLNQATN